MSKCYSARCQQERRLIRKEFNKWTKNILLQIGLETISKNHFQYNPNLFEQSNDETIPNDFNPDEPCLFCINRQESNQDKWRNDDEDFPLDLSLKSTPSHHSQSYFNMKSDIPPLYNSEEFLLSSHINFDYLNLFSTFSINHNDDYINELAKQMAYSRMIQELEYQRTNKKSSNNSTEFLNSSSILNDSMHVNHILNDIMIRMLNEMYQEQIKQQQTRVSRQGELLFVKKQNNNFDDITIINSNKQHKHNNHLNPLPSSSSSISSKSSTCSSSINKKKSKKSKVNSLSAHTISPRRPKEIISNSKIMIGTDGKQVRPKRGHYRRYESEQLAKAVAAVVSNEMSVHKAGSYFGVPHSTLEYKVKERNSKMKNKNELSSSMTVNDDMKYGESSIRSQSNSTENENDDEEIQFYISSEIK